MLDNFLLENKTAYRLYHETAAGLPIIDYHNHLDDSKLSGKLQDENITSLWVSSDPYKHRAMRMNGIPECRITGNATDEEKFDSWMQTLPYTAGGPLYDWSRIELKNNFNIDYPHKFRNIEEIYSECNISLKSNAMSQVELLKKYNVEAIHPCADICDDLSDYLTAENIRISPSLRGDSIIDFRRECFTGHLEELSSKTGINIQSINDYIRAISVLLDEFDHAGCVLADHSLDDSFDFVFSNGNEIETLFEKLLNHDELTKENIHLLQTYLLLQLSRKYAEMGWAMQLHFGALRETSSRLRKLTGAAGGYATIGSIPSIRTIAHFFDILDVENSLPKVILYTLNPAYNEALANITGSFSEDNLPGKLQFGPAWWFNDHRYGIENHLQVLSNYSILGRFIGMTTDSRNVLSFSRHEYFRRIICSVIGKWYEAGIIPDHVLADRLVCDIAYNNIKNYLKKDK